MRKAKKKKKSTVEISTNNSIKKFIEFVLEVCKRPAMFHVNRVEELNVICIGFQCALTDNDAKSLNEFLGDFREYVNHHFEMNSNYNWDSVIRLHSGSDLHSLPLFQRLFKDYLVTKNKNLH